MDKKSRLLTPLVVTAALSVVAFAGLAIVALGGVGLSLLQGPWWPAGTPAASVPVKAVRYLEHRPGRVFSTYLWNDYLDYVGIPEFVDGRTELYTSGPVLRQYLTVDEMTSKPDSILHAYDVKFVLWPTDSALSFYLREDPGWQVVWHSSQATIFHYTDPQTRKRLSSSEAS